jgi:hypothetical protein
MRVLRSILFLFGLLVGGVASLEAQQTNAQQPGTGECYDCEVQIDPNGMIVNARCVFEYAQRGWTSCIPINNPFISTCMVGGRCLTPVSQELLDEVDALDQGIRIASAIQLLRRHPNHARISTDGAHLEVVNCGGKALRTVALLSAPRVLALR